MHNENIMGKIDIALDKGGRLTPLKKDKEECSIIYTRGGVWFLKQN